MLGRQMYTAEPLVPEPICSKVAVITEKFKPYKSPGTDQIQAEQIQARGNTLHFETHKFVNSIRNEAELLQQWEESSIVPLCVKGDKTD
jgi:hypothetical protein